MVAVVYGGGTPVPQILRTVAQNYAASPRSTTVGLRRTADGRRVAIRVSVVLPCGKDPYGARPADDLVAVAALAADGTFVVNRRQDGTDLGAGAVLGVRGRLTATGATGFARVRSKYRCGAGRRAWTARAVNPFAMRPAAPRAPAGGVLYGATTQDAGGFPHGVVAVVAGRTAHLAFSYTSSCVFDDHGHRTDGPYTHQTLLTDRPVGDGIWSWHSHTHATPAQRRRHVSGWRRFDAVARFAGGGLFGTLADADRLAQPGYSERCRPVRLRFVAVR